MATSTFRSLHFLFRRNQIERVETNFDQKFFHSSRKLFGHEILPVTGLRVLRIKIKFLIKLVLSFRFSFCPQDDVQFVVRQFSKRRRFEFGRWGQNFSDFWTNKIWPGREEKNRASVAWSFRSLNEEN